MNTKFMASSVLALTHRYKDLLSSQKLVDCSFNVDQTIIKCHKLILSTASPVFEAMFYGPLQAEQKNIDILDISPEAFRLMIEYIYSCDIDFEKISIETIIELYYSGEKYFLTDLVRVCLTELPAKLRFENILPAMDLSVYMDLQPIWQICISFFGKCCLQGHEFRSFLKTNYYHITKECLKLLVELNYDYKKSLCWFVREWCQNECKNLSLNTNDYNMVLNDLELPELKQLDFQGIDDFNVFPKTYVCSYAERVYYKARRPFIVSDDCTEFNVILKTNRFISLLGIVTKSRLIPKIITDNSFDQEYMETLNVEIESSDRQLVHRQNFINQRTNYNCDLNILMTKNVILSPNKEYNIKLAWDRNASGAEYPCSLYSNEARGITFIDQFSNFDDVGSIFKGIKYLNLV